MLWFLWLKINLGHILLCHTYILYIYKKIIFIFHLFYVVYIKAYKSDIYYPKKEKLCNTLEVQ